MLCGVVWRFAMFCGVVSPVYCLLRSPQPHVSIYKQFSAILYFSFQTTSKYSGALSSLCLCGLQQTCNCLSVCIKQTFNGLLLYVKLRCSTNTPTRCGALRRLPRGVKIRVPFGVVSFHHFNNVQNCSLGTAAISAVGHQYYFKSSALSDNEILKVNRRSHFHEF